MTNYCGNDGIAGCQFTLFPMSDQFVDIVLSALDEVDTSNVWKDTDDVSTTVRGDLAHVFDVVKAIYLHAVKTGEHVAMSGTFSIGCPGDTPEHVKEVTTNELKNESTSKQISQKAGCKFALYPMGHENYMDLIVEQIDLSNSRGVEVSSSHYATRLDGEVNDIFRAMEEAFIQVNKRANHVTMTFTISANSPSNR